MSKTNIESPTTVQNVRKTKRNIGHETLVWAHMGAFALTAAALVIERHTNDIHELLCNSRSHLNQRLFQGLPFNSFFCKYGYLCHISLCLT